MNRLISNRYCSGLFLDDFAKLRKATISFVVSVLPPVRMEIGYYWTIFQEI